MSTVPAQVLYPLEDRSPFNLVPRLEGHWLCTGKWRVLCPRFIGPATPGRSWCFLTGGSPRVHAMKTKGIETHIKNRCFIP